MNLEQWKSALYSTPPNWRAISNNVAGYDTNVLSCLMPELASAYDNLFNQYSSDDLDDFNSSITNKEKLVLGHSSKMYFACFNNDIVGMREHFEAMVELSSNPLEENRTDVGKTR